MIRKNTLHYIDQAEIGIYLYDVRKYDTLTREEEYVLIEKIRDFGCKKSEKELIYANLRYVITMAKQYQNQGLNLADLVSEGNYGLIKAAKKFDYTQKEVRFLSYAVWWIKQSITQSLHENSRIIRLPVNVINDISKKKQAIRKEYDDDSSIIVKMGLPVIKYLAEPIDREGNLLNDIIEDKNSERPDIVFADDKMLLLEKLKNILNRLSKSEQYIIMKYFGLDGDPLTLKDISGDLGLTKERVRQIKERCIKKLRNYSVELFDLL